MSLHSPCSHMLHGMDNKVLLETVQSHFAVSLSLQS